jgi:hypothetical protein
MKDQLKILKEAQKNLSFENITKAFTDKSGMGDKLKGATDKMDSGISDFFMQGFGDMMNLGTSDDDMGLKSLLGDFIPEELQNILGFDETPELKKDPETPDMMGPNQPTETQQRVAAQNQQASDSASRTINDPSAGNGGVIRDQSQASNPGISESNNGINTIVSAIHTQPANRTGMS